MKVGDYVRTKRGIIGKIKLIDNQTELEDLYLVKRKWYYKKYFIKASPNIIDLIEVGDYVNGNKIIKISKDHCERIILIYGYDDGNRQVAITIYEDEIKSIVTKEAFKSMEYKIGE